MAYVPGTWDWMVVVGGFGAFGFGWGTGANDVANAFGTSVGSGALTNTQAICIAAVFEFVGAMVLGRVSTSVIAGSIADRTKFPDPPVYGYGMMWTMWVGTIWLAVATYNGWNVSSTHSIIGGIIGFALAYNKDGVLWLTEDPLSIPPYKGVVPIVLAWFFAPICTGFSSAVMFFFIRTFVLRTTESYERSLKLLPLLILCTTWINIYFVFTKGAKKTFNENDPDEWSDDKAAWVACCVAAGLALVSIAFIPWVRSRADALEHKKVEKEMSEKEMIGIPASEAPSKKIENAIIVTDPAKEDKFKNFADAINFHGKGKDGKDFMDDLNENVQAMHDRAEIFDRKSESVFSVLQVFSACCVMFAHGAGEVGYMAGPLTTIDEINNTGKLPKNVSAPIWILFLSAISLVIGLATYGQRITRAMGKEMAVITPARGFCAELSTAIVIMVAAQYGLPTSSSQCITGGILGIGLVEGVNGVNWKLFGSTFASWVLTLFVMGLGTAALFAQGHAAP